MLTKIVDLALSATFLAVHMLSRLQNHLRSRTPGVREEDRLMAEWIAARRARFALQAELNQPTTSRPYGAQSTLLQAANAAGAKCHTLLVALKAQRKRNSV